MCVLKERTAAKQTAPSGHPLGSGSLTQARKAFVLKVLFFCIHGTSVRLAVPIIWINLSSITDTYRVFTFLNGLDELTAWKSSNNPHRSPHEDNHDWIAIGQNRSSKSNIFESRPTSTLLIIQKLESPDMALVLF